jgi:hypothetical protein
MGVRLVCDGDNVLLDPKDAVQVGTLDPVAYCQTCKSIWDATEAAIHVARVTAITTFTAARAEALTAARKTLAKLPDDPGGGE